MVSSVTAGLAPRERGRPATVYRAGDDTMRGGGR